MSKLLFVLLFLELLSYLNCNETFRQATFPNWKLHYPDRSVMGIFLAVAIPLNLPRHSAYLAFNWEANYVLPNNQTEFTYPPILQKRINRKLAYDAIETKLQSQGYSGRYCMLRIICEASALSVSESNGVFGEIMHILLTPSTSQNDGLSKAYKLAETRGKMYKSCRKNYYQKCPISFLDLISWIEHVK